MAATWDDVKRIGLELPDVEVSTWYGTPALKVSGKGFCRLRMDEEAIVLMVDMLEREALMQSEPDMFFITPHYEDWPAMLVRLATVDPEMLREQIIESWLRKAPKRLADAYLEEVGG
jgi:hypothetical protein